MKYTNRILLSSLLAMAPFSISMCWASASPSLPPAQHAGPITYISGGGTPAQAEAIGQKAAGYPLELDFLWGRGAKETPIANVDWSIRNAPGHEMLDAHSNGPEVLASLPNGRYTVTARYEGTTRSRVVDVHQGMHDTVVLEWPQ